MRRSAIPSVILFAFCAFAAPLLAHANPRVGRQQSEHVGKVTFPTSCAPDVQGTIEKGVALLHSFQYEESERVFADAAQRDPHCAIADWGKAMALYHQLWDFPTPETLSEGQKDVDDAAKRGAASSREREYIAAADAFFQNDPKLSHTARTQAYSTAMEKVYRDNPQDVDAGAFYALSLVSLAQDQVDEMANRRKAIAILNPLFVQEPDNPGVAHYLIHASDTPELAQQGLPAARAYAKIAPDSSHATHMPSHIFRRLGLWQEMIDSNVAAVAAAAEATQQHRGDASYQFHPMDFLDYAYLQSGQEAKARHLVDEVKDVPGAKAEDIADHQSMFEARNALELHRWKDAASLEIPNERLIWQDVTYWARAIGAARSGDPKGAHEDLAKLVEIIQAREKHQRDLGNEVAAGEGVDQSEAEAWVAYADGKPKDALAKLRSAADREKSEDDDPFATPAEEMLADLLLELNRPADALKEYQAVLTNYPNRFDALYGAARAAELAGQPQLAHEFYAKLVAVTALAADRPELREARQHAAGAD